MIIWEKLDPENPPHFGDMGLLVIFEDSAIEKWSPHGWSVKEIIERIIETDQVLPTHYSEIQWPRGWK